MIVGGTRPGLSDARFERPSNAINAINEAHAQLLASLSGLQQPAPRDDPRLQLAPFLGRCGLAARHLALADRTGFGRGARPDLVGRGAGGAFFADGAPHVILNTPGANTHPGTSALHVGWDFLGARGEPVVSPVSGSIAFLRPHFPGHAAGAQLRTTSALLVDDSGRCVKVTHLWPLDALWREQTAADRPIAIRVGDCIGAVAEHADNPFHIHVEALGGDLRFVDPLLSVPQGAA